jgi:hypothetical protein
VSGVTEKSQVLREVMLETGTTQSERVGGGWLLTTSDDSPAESLRNRAVRMALPYDDRTCLRP